MLKSIWSNFIRKTYFPWEIFLIVVGIIYTFQIVGGATDSTLAILFFATLFGSFLIRDLNFFAFHFLSICGLFLLPIHIHALYIVLISYFIGMAAVTVGLHRYFSHRSFNSPRWFQFLMGFMACTVEQRGVLWWVAAHRHHHACSDTVDDYHSPVQRGLIYAHLGWLGEDSNRDNWREDSKLVPDLAAFPELVFLERFKHLPLLICAIGIYFLGAYLHKAGITPLSGWEFVFWGVCFRTMILWHGTFTINSFMHSNFGSAPYETDDNSRNSMFFAIITLGEGWHNNHHKYPTSVRQGLKWWQLDISYWIIRGFSLVGLASNLRNPQISSKDVLKSAPR